MFLSIHVTNPYSPLRFKVSWLSQQNLGFFCSFYFLVNLAIFRVMAVGGVDKVKSWLAARWVRSLPACCSYIYGGALLHHTFTFMSLNVNSSNGLPQTVIISTKSCTVSPPKKNIGVSAHSNHSVAPMSLKHHSSPTQSHAASKLSLGEPAIVDHCTRLS